MVSLRWPTTHLATATAVPRSPCRIASSYMWLWEMATAMQASQITVAQARTLMITSTCDLSDFFRSMTTVKSQTSHGLTAMRRLLADFPTTPRSASHA